MDKKLTQGTSSDRLRLLKWDAMDWSVPVDYHIHTTHTDGTASVRQMADSAVSKGIVEVLFSEHVRRTSTYFTSFAHEIRDLNRQDLKPYVGVETKILDKEGRLDCSAETALMCDAIIGSVHRPPSNNDGKGGHIWTQLDEDVALKLEFDLALSIITRSQAHIIGHPMGMVIKNFNLRPLEHLYKLACACRDFDKAFELNARYCPSPHEWIDIVRQANCKVSFGSDAHSISEVGSSWNMFALKKG